MVASFSTNDLGSGEQIATISAAGVPLSMEEEAFFRLRLWHKANRLVGLTLLASSFVAVAVPDGDATVITYTHAEGSWVELTLEEGRFGDSVEVAVRADLQGSHAATYAIDSIEIAVGLAPLGEVANWRAFMANEGGSVIPEPLALNTGIYTGLPNPRSASYPGILEGEGVVTGWHQLMVVWDDVLKRGLALTTTDVEYRGKVFFLGTDGTSNSLVLRLYPEDGRNATSFTWPYSVDLVPLAGDLFDAFFLYRDRMQALGLPSFEAGPLRGRNDRNPLLENLGAWLWIDGSGAGPHAIQWDRYLRDARAVRDILGLPASRVGVLNYSWGNRPIGDKWPNGQFPALPGAVQALTDMRREGFTTGAYVIVHPIHPDDARATEFRAYVVQDEMGTPRVWELPGATSQLDSEHWHFDWTDSGVRADRIAYWADRFAQSFPAGFQFFYLDAEGAWGPAPQFKPGLPPERQGLGSATAVGGARDLLGEFRTGLATPEGAPFVSTEHPSEFAIGRADLVSSKALSLLAGQSDPRQTLVSMTEFVFGEHQRFTNFTAALYVAPGRPSEAIGYAWSISMMWHDGKILTIASRPEIYDYVVPEAGDPNAAEWETYYRPVFDFARSLYQDPDGLLGRIRTWRLMRPLDESHLRDLVTNGYRYQLLLDPVSGTHVIDPEGMQKMHSSVRFDPVTETFAVLLSNWHATESATLSVVMTPEDYPELKRTMVVGAVNLSTREVSAFPEAENGVSLSMTLGPRQSAVLIISPRGAAKRVAHPGDKVAVDKPSFLVIPWWEQETIEEALFA